MPSVKIFVKRLSGVVQRHLFELIQVALQGHVPDERHSCRGRRGSVRFAIHPLRHVRAYLCVFVCGEACSVYPCPGLMSALPTS